MKKNPYIYSRVLKPAAVLVAAFSFSVSAMVLSCSAATVRWSRPSPGASPNWSVSSNWSTGQVPGPDDDVIFDGTSTLNSVIDSSRVVKSITITRAYTGVITHRYVVVPNNVSLAVLNNYDQRGGKYIVENAGVSTSYYPFSVGGSFFVTSEAVFSRYETSGGYYLVHDIYGLQAMRCSREADYKLKNDIDASPTANWNYSLARSTYEGFVPIGISSTEAFMGTLDGDFRSITGLRIERHAEDFVGLFAALGNGSVVSNLSLTGARITGWSVRRLAGIAAYSDALSAIENCHVSAQIFANGSSSFLQTTWYAGLVSAQSKGRIERTYSSGAIHLNRRGQYVQYIYSGGIAGYSEEDISECYSSGEMVYDDSNQAWIGGVAGYNAGPITDSYFSGRIQKPAPKFGIGGIAGYNAPGGSVSGSYFHQAEFDNKLGTLKTAQEMSREANYHGWDFRTTWSIDESRSYPYLIWTIYNWKGNDTGIWTSPSDWNKNSGYPSMESQKVYANSGVFDFETPLTPLTIGGLKLGPDLPVKLTLGSDLTLSSAAGKSGSLILYGSTLEGAGRTITVHGDFAVSAESRFYPNTALAGGSGTLEISSAAVATSIKGNTRLYNLRINQPDKRVTFEAGSVHTVEGHLYLSGEAGREIMLRSSVPGSRWRITAEGSVVARHLIVADSHNIGPVISAADSYDGGNNTGWNFGGYAVSVRSNTGGSISPSGVLGEVLSPMGSPTTLEITSDSGYYIGFVRIDGTYEAGPYVSPHKVVVPGNGAHSVEAYFVRDNIRIWTGARTGEMALWEYPENWTGYQVPSADESAVFNGLSSRECIIGPIVSDVTVKNITIESSYLGKITQLWDLVVGGSFEQYGGTFESYDWDPETPRLKDFSVGENFRIPDTPGAFKRFVGNGDSVDPYIIYDIYGLQAVRCNLDKHFKLNNSIDASSTKNWNWNGSTHEGFAPIGFMGAGTNADTPDNPFTGTFNGAGNTISGIFVNRSGAIHVGVFGAAVSSHTKGIYDLGVAGAYVRGYQTVGGMVGYNTANIYDCSFSGEAYCEDYFANLGGFVGVNINGRTISRCRADAIVERMGNPYNSIYIGLFAGINGGTISNSFARGTVRALFYAGGFAGASYGTIQKSYTDGILDADLGGGFLGQGLSSGLTSCYYTQARKPNFNNLATRIDQTQLKDKDTFSGWDFDSVWAIDEGQRGPYLLWEYYRWTGNAGDSDWTNPGNWSRDLQPAADYPRTYSDHVFLNDNSAVLSTPAPSGLQLGELVLGSSYAGKLTLANDLMVSSESFSKGNIVMCKGTLEASGVTVSVEGDFRSVTTYGEPYTRFISGTGTVEIFGRNKTSLVQLPYPVYADFNDLRCSTPGKELSFYSSGFNVYHTKVRSNLFLSGEAGLGNLVVLQGTAASPSAWNISAEGTVSVTNAIVFNSKNIGTNIITAANSYDGGNNTRWAGFIGNAITAVAGAGGMISPEGIIPVASGDTVEFVVTSSEGYYIGFVKIDGIATDEALSTFEARFYLTADGSPHSIEAYFSQAGTRTWTGGAADGFWSSPCNWTGNSTPQANEKVVFNQTSSKNSIIDQFNPTNTIYALSIESQSTALITQISSLTISATYEQHAGRFLCTMPATALFAVGGDFIIPETYSFLTPPFRRMSGTGTSGNPFLIYDVYGLQGILGTRSWPSYNYKLAQNIDASPTRRWNWNGVTHEGFYPIGEDTVPFSGILYGDHRIISGLWINRPVKERVALFGHINGTSVIRNLGISGSSIIGQRYVGGLGGWAMGKISGCYFSGYVSGESYVGGLVGESFGSDAIIRSSFSRGSVVGNDVIGGLVGNNSFYSQIYDSYSSASVEAKINVAGGLAGNGSYVYRSYAAGKVTAPGNVGGLIGGFPSEIENSFFSDPLTDNHAGTLTTEANMKRRRNFEDAGWDFGRIWGIDEGRTTPYFHWEKWLWTGAGDGTSWDDAENWNKHSSYPQDNAAKVYIGTSDATISTPGVLTLPIGGLQLTSNFTGKISLGNNLVLDSGGGHEGSLYIYNGTLEAGNRQITIHENFYKSGSAIFDKGTGAVVFDNDSKPSLISGNTSFYNLFCNTAGKKITFEATTRQTIEGIFAVTGEAGDQVFLRSSLRGITWEVFPLRTSNVTVESAVVQDSKNTSTSAITAVNSIDYGNNLNWLFANFAIEIYAGSNGYVNGTGGNFYVSTFEGGTIEVTVSPESSSYYIADVKIDGRSTTESLYHPGSPHIFTFHNVRRFYTFEAQFLPVGYKTWDGGGSTSNWSEALNWTGNSTPQAAERVKFSSYSTKNATIDASFSGVVGGISIESGYTGTIRQVTSLTVNGSFEQGGGYFVCTTPTVSAFTVSGNFYIPDNSGAFIRYTGTGTSASTAYVVHDIYGLQGVRSNLDKYFKLFFDIDAAVTRGWNWNGSTHEGFIPIGSLSAAFTGSFSGESFVVRNLWIDRSGKNSPLGDETALFGRVGEGGLIHRFGVRSSHIKGDYITGALVGANLGRVSRCLVSGTLVEGRLVLGGLVGGSTGTIEDSYSTASVVLTETYGGVLCGFNQGGSISRSYAAGAVSFNGEGFLGGTDSGAVSYCYYSTYESGKSGDNYGALPLTPVQMKQQASFETWNFDTVWSIDEDKSYPSLLWEEYNWTGLGDNFSWTDPLNWNKKSGYPWLNTHKAYINTGTGGINTPAQDLTIGALILGPNFSGALTLLSDLYLGNNGPREGSFLMFGGNLASSRATQIVVEGRFKNTVGTFLSGSTIIFSGNGRSAIEGSTVFYNFYCTKEGKSLVFEAGSVQTIEGTLRISSEAGTSSRITLSSLTEDSQWYLHPSGTVNPVYFVDVRDSVNLSPETINPFYSVNSGNNVNWFDTYYITSESRRLPPLDLVTDWGTIEPVGIVPVDHGTSRSFTVTPRFSAGYRLASVMVDGISMEGVSGSQPYSYTFEVVTANHSIEAVFAIRPFLITAEVTGIGIGTITPSGTVEVGHSSRQIFTVEAAPGSYIAYVLLDGVATAEGLSDPSYYPSPYWITFEGASSEHTIEAHFLPEKYHVWSGLGDTGNWSEPANWTGNTTPDADSTAIFSWLSTKNASVDADFSGRVRNVSMEAGYTGRIDIGRIFTVEAGVSIESGSLVQTTHEVYVGGNWYCSGEAASFVSEAGTVILTGPEGSVQTITPRQTTFYDLYHSGAAKVSVRGSYLELLNDLNIMPSAGTFELYGVGMMIGGDLTNSSYFTQELISLELDNLVIFFNGIDRVQTISMGGTGEGHILSVILNESSSIRLAGTLETYGIINIGTFDAAGYELFVSTVLLFQGSLESLHVTETPEMLRGIFENDADAMIIGGHISLAQFNCSVPSKAILFQRPDDEGDHTIVTIEASGYVTFEGGGGSTFEYISLIAGGEEYQELIRWVIDPQCPADNRNFRNLIVYGSHNINETSIEAVNSIDGGENIGWVFGYHLITATHNTGGTIEPPAVYLAPSEEDATYRVTAYPGFYIGYILKDGRPVTSDATYISPYYVTFESVTSNHTIEAFFVPEGRRTWTGAGTNEVWSVPDNWSGNQIPASTEVVVFNATSVKNSVIDGFFGGIIGGISVESGYSGTITQSRSLRVTGDFEQGAGGFDSPISFAFTVEGSFSLPGTLPAFARYTGAGSDADPYIIYDVYGLQAVKCHTDKVFILNGDISAESTSRWNWSYSSSTHEGFSPIGLTEEAAFTGKMDGRGFIVRDLWIDRTVNAQRTNIGLFGRLGTGASIRNIGMSRPYVRGYDMVGALAGYADGGSVYGCYASGGFVFGQTAVGGLIGRMTSAASVESSYSANMVQSDAAGGFVGNNSGGTVIGCYSAGYVLGASAGGFVGSGTDVVNCYYGTAESGKTGENLGAYPLDALQIKQRAGFVGWDFDRTWTIDGGKSRPQLMWEIYTWTGSADGISWTNPNNWNKKSGYPQTREHKAFINIGNGTLTISPTVLGGLQLGPDFGGKVVPSASHIVFSSGGTREGSLIVLGGEFDTDSRYMTIEGNFKKGESATFNTSYSARFIRFSGEAASMIEGSTTFQDFVCNTPGKRLNFEAGSLQTIEGVFTLSGSIDSPVTLESSSLGVRFKISPATANVSNVSVRDSTNEGASVINPSGSNLNLGNTSRWFTYYIYATAETNTSIEPSGWRAVEITTTEPITYTITSEVWSGYYVASVEVDGVKVGGFGTTSYDFIDVRRTHTIEVFVTTDPVPTEPPTGLRVNISGNNVVLSWSAVTGDPSYKIYTSYSKFVPIEQWTSLEVTNMLTYVHENATISTTESYYVVRAYTAGGEGPESSMGAYKRLSFTYNNTPPILTNDNRIGLPYTTSLTVLRDIVVSVEGGTGPNTNQKINSVAVWNASGQNYTTFAYVHPIGWLGAAGDTVIEAGAGINIILSGNTGNFSWEAAGVDKEVDLSFTYNNTPPILTNDNRIGLPYTTSLTVLRDIVVSIEGGTGPNTNQKINSVAVWNAGGQNYTTFAYVHPIGWLGAAGDTVIEAGAGINIILSGNTTAFDWPQELVIDPKE